MRYLDLTETSGHSMPGSFTRDLLESKLWALNALAQAGPVSVVYNLGSWYSNLPVIDHLTYTAQVEKYVNVDSNPRHVRGGELIADHLGMECCEHMLADANTLDYRQLDDRGAVVNCSTSDISGTDWFHNIPQGTLCVFQCRDNNPEPMPYESVQDLLDAFPMSQIIRSGERALRDPEVSYFRYQLVGIK